jgi:hypothetical protein
MRGRSIGELLTMSQRELDEVSCTTFRTCVGVVETRLTTLLGWQRHLDNTARRKGHVPTEYARQLAILSFFQAQLARCER